MAEYIFEISEALLNEETGEAVFKPTVTGQLVRCKDCIFFHQSPRLMGDERTDGRCEWINERLVDREHFCSWGTESGEK